MSNEKELEYFFCAVEVILGDEMGQRQMTEEEDKDAMVLALRTIHNDPQRDFSDEELEKFNNKVTEALAAGIVKDAEEGYEEARELIRDIFRKSKLN